MTDSLVRLANSVLWPGFLGTAAPQWLRTELRDGLAGVVYFSQNVGDALPALSASLLAENPNALIGVDEEGGSVSRLEASGSTLPGAAQLGVLDDPAATRATGAELARRVRLVGAHVVLGPVADVNTDPRNPVIGVRSFGADPELVSRHVVAAVEGIQRGGAAACVKHFPGHGDTHLDSHLALPVVELDTAEFERTHLPPFRAAIAAGVDAIMTAHVIVPAWGPEPATLNPAVLGMLRDTGFDGVIITDALDMAAIRETRGIGGGAVRALAAGADLLCIGNPTNPGAAALPDQDRHDFLAARDAIVAALRDGSLPVARVQEAAARVAALAAKLQAGAEPAARDETYRPDDVVRRSIVIHGRLREDYGPFSIIDARNRSSFAVDGDADHVATILAEGGRIRRCPSAPLSEAEYDEIITAAGAPGMTTVLLVDRPEPGTVQRGLIDRAAAIDPGALVINVGLPVHGSIPLTTVDVAAANRVGADVALSLLRRN